MNFNLVTFIFTLIRHPILGHQILQRHTLVIRFFPHSCTYFTMSRGASSRDRLDDLDGEVSEVTSLLKDNVDKVLRRGDKLDDIQQKADDLESSSIQFKKRSSDLRRKMCCSNIRMTLILILVVIVIIAVIVVIVLMTVKPWEHSDNGDGNHGNKTLTYG